MHVATVRVVFPTTTCLSTQEAKKKDEKLLKFPEELQDVQSAAR